MCKASAPQVILLTGGNSAGHAIDGTYLKGAECNGKPTYIKADQDASIYFSAGSWRIGPKSNFDVEGQCWISFSASNIFDVQDVQDMNFDVEGMHLKVTGCDVQAMPSSCKVSADELFERKIEALKFVDTGAPALLTAKECYSSQSEIFKFCRDKGLLQNLPIAPFNNSDWQAFLKYAGLQTCETTSLLHLFNTAKESWAGLEDIDRRQLLIMLLHSIEQPVKFNLSALGGRTRGISSARGDDHRSVVPQDLITQGRGRARSTAAEQIKLQTGDHGKALEDWLTSQGSRGVRPSALFEFCLAHGHELGVDWTDYYDCRTGSTSSGLPVDRYCRAGWKQFSQDILKVAIIEQAESQGTTAEASSWFDCPFESSLLKKLAELPLFEHIQVDASASDSVFDPINVDGQRYLMLPDDFAGKGLVLEHLAQYKSRTKRCWMEVNKQFYLKQPRFGTELDAFYYQSERWVPSLTGRVGTARPADLYLDHVFEQINAYSQTDARISAEEQASTLKVGADIRDNFEAYCKDKVGKDKVDFKANMKKLKFISEQQPGSCTRFFAAVECCSPETTGPARIYRLCKDKGSQDLQSLVHLPDSAYDSEEWNSFLLDIGMFANALGGGNGTISKLSQLAENKVIQQALGALAPGGELLGLIISSHFEGPALTGDATKLLKQLPLFQAVPLFHQPQARFVCIQEHVKHFLSEAFAGYSLIGRRKRDKHESSADSESRYLTEPREQQWVTFYREVLKLQPACRAQIYVEELFPQMDTRAITEGLSWEQLEKIQDDVVQEWPTYKSACGDFMKGLKNACFISVRSDHDGYSAPCEVFKGSECYSKDKSLFQALYNHRVPAQRYDSDQWQELLKEIGLRTEDGLFTKHGGAPGFILQCARAVDRAWKETTGQTTVAVADSDLGSVHGAAVLALPAATEWHNGALANDARPAQLHAIGQLILADLIKAHTESQRADRKIDEHGSGEKWCITDHEYEMLSELCFMPYKNPNVACLEADLSSSLYGARPEEGVQAPSKLALPGEKDIILTTMLVLDTGKAESGPFNFSLDENEPSKFSLARKLRLGVSNRMDGCQAGSREFDGPSSMDQQSLTFVCENLLAVAGHCAGQDRAYTDTDPVLRICTAAYTWLNNCLKREGDGEGGSYVTERTNKIRVLLADKAILVADGRDKGKFRFAFPSTAFLDNKKD